MGNFINKDYNCDDIEDIGNGIKWSHRTNDKYQLINALKNDNISAIEADVITIKDDIPVMGHSLTETNYFPLYDFLEYIYKYNESVKTKKIIKLDFKTSKSVYFGINILNKFISINEEDNEIPVRQNNQI